MRQQKRLLFLVLAILILFYAIMTAYKENKRSHITNQPIVDLVKQRFAAMNRHDTDAIAKLYADGAVIQSPNAEKDVLGPAGIRSVYRRYFLTSPDMKYSITRIIPADSSATVEFTFTGTMQHMEDAGAKYMLGKRYTLKSCVILEVHDQKFVRDVSYFDQVAFLRQVGFFEQK